MKVIANINSDDVLVQATREELKMLEGSYYPDSHDFKVGAELNIHIMYEQAQYILDNPKKIQAAIDGLESVVRNLELIAPFTAPEVKDEEE